MGNGLGAESVAILSLTAPSRSPFVLRATIPVPPGFHDVDSGTSPFMVRAPQGAVSRAQVEVVSQYSATEDGADVLQLLAIVESPPGTQSGSQLTYEVLHAQNAPMPHSRSDSVRELLATPGSVLLRTKDVFGHRYDADLLRDIRVSNAEDLRVLRNGEVALQVRTHENLAPRNEVDGPLGTLPHMMGVHSYVTTWRDEEFISLDIRVHNGHDGLDQDDESDDPMGTLYFNELELLVPDGWRVFQAYQTPSMGVSYHDGSKVVQPLVGPLTEGALHVIAPQGQFHRRLVLVRNGQEARALAMLREEGLAFCQAGVREDGEQYFSWWNPRTARYWAQNLPLPNLDYLETPAESRAEMDEGFAELHTALSLGSPGPWPVVSGSLGWAHPYGLKVGNMHGGSEIYFFDGIKTAWGASTTGYRTFQMTHRMYSERHPTALYNRNGDSYSLDDWIYAGPEGTILPNWMFLVPWLSLGDPFGFTTAPTFQVDAVVNQGRQPPYEDQLLDYKWIDTQHLIRYTRSAKVLAWLGNDAIAKEDLHLQAELCRASYSIYPQNEQGYLITTGLGFDRQYVESHPQDGFVIDRGEGWMLDTVASAYALGDPEFRRSAHSWFVDVIDLISEGQSSCSGTIMSKPNQAHFNGQYRIMQSISEAILQNGLWGVLTSVLNEEHVVEASVLKGILASSTYAMINPRAWDDSANTPYFYTALGPYDQSQAPFCDFVPPDGHEGTDGWQTWNVFVFGMKVTDDPRFLHRATQMAGGTLTPAMIGQDNHPGELETRAGMISFLQVLRSPVGSPYETQAPRDDGKSSPMHQSSKD
jgi:hypothetical protein